MNSAAVTVGATVVLSADFCALTGADGNVLHMVCDMHGAGRDPLWTVAPIATVGVDSSKAREVWADDLRVVR